MTGSNATKIELPQTTRLVHAAGVGPTAETKPEKRRRRGLLFLLASLVAATGFAVGGWWWVNYGPAAFTQIPAVSGLPLAEAQQRLGQRGVDYVVEETPSDTVPVGLVIETTPRSGTYVHESDAVTVIVSAPNEARPSP